MQGIARLMGTLTSKHPINQLPIDLEESTLMEVLAELEWFDFHIFEEASSSAQRARAHVRYLSALWPEATITELGQRIHDLLNNRNISFSDVMTVLRGERVSERAQLDDLRIVLRGGQLGDAQRQRREVPVPVIQGIGRCLMGGMNLSETARMMRVSVDTVRAIEKFLGLRSAYQQRKLGAAVDAVRDGTSIRQFASTHGISKSSAELLFREARSVLVELGEAQ
jgi:transposase-like protein